MAQLGSAQRIVRRERQRQNDRGSMPSLSEHVKELSPSSTFIFPATDLFSVKLGFDLLLAR